MINRDRLVQRFIRLAEIGSESFNEKEIKEFLWDEFTSRGFECREDKTGAKIGGNCGNLLVRIPGQGPGPVLLFSAHMDTVKPGNGVEPVIENNCIKSSGDTILGSDDKAAIAAILEVIEVLNQQKIEHPPMELLFTVAEEQGLMGAKMFDYSQLQARFGYTMDAGGDPGTIIIQSPCQNEIEYKVYGKAAHAGINPEDGRNAIHLAARALAKMPCGRVDEDTTCNFGLIEGGKARNIVADFCRVKGEARSLNGKRLDQITARLTETFTKEVEGMGGRAEVEVQFLYPEVSLSEEDQVVKIASRAVASLGLSPRLESTGGGSDASIINGNGIPCVNLAVGMRAVHTTDEYIYIDDLVKDAQLILALIKEVGH
ncbi:M20/M25/M40 family metallo-hydrolase [Syntrophomonas erecta]